MALPEVSSYTPAQITKACELFPILSDYQSILKKNPVNELDQLRKSRTENFMSCVLANYFKTATPEAVCYHWSQFANHVVSTVYRNSKLSSFDLSIFAVGKLGANELNLSSDIDLLFIQGESQVVDKRAFADFLLSLSQKTEFGFLFRVDTDLRPGGRMGPIICTPHQFEDYYGNYGETWERLALVRLRPIIGNPQVVGSINQIQKKFCFRKHLDYTLLEELKSLRSKIQHFYLNQTEHTFNLKQGLGGIRDIELYVHALQVIHGGKNPVLQTHSTTQALQHLRASTLLSPDDANFFEQTYWTYRHLENLVQSKNDQQTHTWTQDFNQIEPRAWVTISENLQKVDRLVSSLIGAAGSEVEIPQELPEQLKWLEKQEIRSPKVLEIWPTLIATKVQSSNSQRDERERLIFLQSFILELRRATEDLELPFLLLADFLKSVRAKASFFTMLNRNPQMTKELVRLFSLSPYLSHIMISRPELLDSFILKTTEIREGQVDSLIEDLGDNKLLTELICSSQFLLHKDVSRLTRALSESADRTLSLLLKKTREEFPNSQLEILALGKWSGFELGLTSDLDFIFITPDEPNKDDHSVAKRMITRLTQKNRGGHLYSIDFRLRPSGKAGPIIVGRTQLKEFLEENAKVWERQAYLRSRALADSNFLPAGFSIKKALTKTEATELLGIKKQLLKEPPQGFDIKYSQGALLDIEFCCQWALIKRQIFSTDTSTSGMIQTLSQTSSLWKSFANTLLNNYNFLRQLEQIKQLVTSAPGTDLNLAQTNIEKIARLIDSDPATLFSTTLEVLKQNQEIFKSLDPLGATS